MAGRFFTWLTELLPGLASGTIEYQAASETFRLSGGSFFQTNRFLVDALVNQPKPSIIAMLLAAAGIPFYLLWRRGPQLRDVRL